MAESKVAARGKGPKLPVIMTANDLLDGEVVFLGAEGWTFDPHGALVAEDEETAERYEAQGRQDLAANRIVDPYLVEVTVENGEVTARHFREAIRLKGPTIHPEMGKQAEY
ncbi:DUF2849 domain-containing protein [Aureimonas mangrovi]|uniref:DUF2849 domain-containing protein n=1 Tax=Aureimonas mangrovi TaxID=2758041 RepID=UPI00163D6FF0|nr:DUF2849 domain-containing protein [Aureimonas mangrovi]